MGAGDTTAAATSAFGALLRSLRLAAGLTQEALAERAGISARAVNALERDPARLPRLDSVALLADALGLEAGERARFLAAARPAGAAPASAPPQSPSRDLPRPLTPLIGRADDIAAVAGRLRGGQSRLLTLTGPGGVGKTRLALAAAECVAGDFAAGAVFVDQAPLRDARLVLPTVAQRLGVDERAGGPLRDRLAAALRGKRLLLLLDNLEHLLAARAEVLALLEASPDLVVLGTSRVPLHLRGEREYRVAQLALPDEGTSPELLGQSAAVALFLERARATDTDLPLDATTAPAVAQICRRLDGLPLAIELAAAWTRLLPPAALLARLDHRLPLLVGVAHDLPDRQRTMRDAIAWSYDLLDAPQQRLFRWLCVFAGGCAPEAAERVCADAGSAGTVLHGLAALADRSLLMPQVAADAGGAEPRLLLLETIREYGLERLEESGERDAARARHAAHYLALAEAVDPHVGGHDGRAWQARLERDQDNLRAALAWLLGRGDGESALRLAAALWRFWSARGYLGEGRRWLRAALAATDSATATGPNVRRRALAGAAALAIEHGGFDEAAALCDEAVAAARRPGAERDLVTALNASGWLARELGRYAEAARAHGRALALARQLGDRAGEAAALTGLAYARTFGGEVAAGQALAERGIAAYRAAGEALGGEALELCRALGDTGQLAEALRVLAIAAQFRGRLDRAILLHEEGVMVRRARGDERGTIQPLSALAAIALQRGDLQRTRALLDEAAGILRRYDDRWALAMSLTLEGQVALPSGNIARAEQCLTEGAALHQAIGNPLYLPWCLEGLAGVAAARGVWATAARLCGARDALRERLGAPLPPAYPAGYDATLAAIRAALGEESFAAELGAGRALTPDEAIAEAVAPSAGSH